MSVSANQIVVYQPNETVWLDVRLENGTVWLTHAQLCALFGVVKSNVSYLRSQNVASKIDVMEAA